MAKKPISMDDAIKREKVAIPQRGDNGDDGKKKIAVTVKLTDSEYDRLAMHGIKTRQKHQQILLAALMKYLGDANE
jgi:hypothetical protein